MEGFYMNIVKGGGGFIGSNIVKGLNKKGYEDILIVDDLENGNKSRNMNALSFIDYIDKDKFIENINIYRNSNLKAIIHQGACTDTMETNGKYMMSLNYEYSKKLFDFCGNNNIQFIYASSASVYGKGKNGFKEIRKNENPINVYAFSKFLFDQYVRRNKKKIENQVVGLRYFNVYGQQENHKGRMASPVYKFYNQIKQEGVAKVFEKSEKYLRDFIYVNDVVDVNLYFLENKDTSGIFNCGTGNANSFVDVANIIIKYFKKGKILEIPFPEKLKGKYQDYTQADLNNLREEGYTNKFIKLEDGIKSYLNYLEKNNGYLYL